MTRRKAELPTGGPRSSLPVGSSAIPFGKSASALRRDLSGRPTPKSGPDDPDPDHEGRDPGCLPGAAGGADPAGVIRDGVAGARFRRRAGTLVAPAATASARAVGGADPGPALGSAAGQD